MTTRHDFGPPLAEPRPAVPIRISAHRDSFPINSIVSLEIQSIYIYIIRIYNYSITNNNN